MNFKSLPSEIISIILSNLDKVEDLISWSMANKHNRSFCIKRRQELLKSFNTPLYGIDLQERQVTRVVNYKVVTQTLYSCPLCLNVYDNLQFTCIECCFDCGRTMCKRLSTNIWGSPYFQKEPEYGSGTIRISRRQVYRCEVCYLYEHDGTAWIPRVFTPEQEKAKLELIKSTNN
jgi:hypothetical protein